MFVRPMPINFEKMQLNLISLITFILPSAKRNHRMIAVGLDISSELKERITAYSLQF